MSKSQLKEGAESGKRGQIFSEGYNYPGGESSCKPELVLVEVNGAFGELGTFGDGKIEGQEDAKTGIKIGGKLGSSSGRLQERSYISLDQNNPKTVYLNSESADHEIPPEEERPGLENPLREVDLRRLESF